MTTATDPVSISVPQAARVLGISRDHAYDLAAEDRLPGAYRMGGRTLVHVPTLLAQIEALATKVAPAHASIPPAGVPAPRDQGSEPTRAGSSGSSATASRRGGGLA